MRCVPVMLALSYFYFSFNQLINSIKKPHQLEKVNLKSTFSFMQAITCNMEDLLMESVIWLNVKMHVNSSLFFPCFRRIIRQYNMTTFIYHILFYILSQFKYSGIKENKIDFLFTPLICIEKNQILFYHFYRLIRNDIFKQATRIM